MLRYFFLFWFKQFPRKGGLTKIQTFWDEIKCRNENTAYWRHSQRVRMRAPRPKKQTGTKKREKKSIASCHITIGAFILIGRESQFLLYAGISFLKSGVVSAVLHTPLSLIRRLTNSLILCENILKIMSHPNCKSKGAEILENIYHPQNVTCLLSCVSCHGSCVMCHVSCVVCHLFIVIQFSFTKWVS